MTPTDSAYCSRIQSNACSGGAAREKAGASETSQRYRDSVKVVEYELTTDPTGALTDEDEWEGE